MAMELHNLTSKTVEPLANPALTATRASDFMSRLGGSASGRMALNCMNWAMVIGLIVSGYFGAAAIDSGVRLVRSNPSSPHQILAAVGARP